MRHRLLNSPLAAIAAGLALPQNLSIVMHANRDGARAAWHARFDNRRKVEARDPGKLTVTAASADTTEMMFYDEVGFWGITAKQFADALAAVTTPRILLRINSPGGDVFDGYAIYNALKQSQKQVSVVVDGLAASAASFIAMAGDTLSMGDPSMMMVHRAMTFAYGNVNDLAAVKDLLAKVDGQIADIYAGKSGRPASDMLAMMDAETWLTAQEAADNGLIDEIIQPNEPDEEGASAAAQAHAARLRAAQLVSLGIRQK
jgi:ATP-dependent Clp endopeptidase proteolytic subunit ClpP